MASRFDREPDALAKQMSAEGSSDGYDDIGINSAMDCYAKAAEYARKAIGGGNTPLTEDQWMNSKTGFNTPQSSWMLGTYVTSKEEINTGYYYNSFVAQIASEPTWGMPRYGSAFRLISKSLYDKISDSDWRKNSWISPDAPARPRFRRSTEPSSRATPGQGFQPTPTLSSVPEAVPSAPSRPDSSRPSR